MHRTLRAAACAATVALAALFTGCGSGSSTVRGKVTAQGKAVVWGSVILVDQGGNYKQGEIGPDGSYEIAGVRPGPVKIGVASPNPEGRKGGGGRDATPRKKDGAPDPGPERPKPPPGAWFALDTKYADPGTSGLTGEVKGGAAELNIDVK